jgi:hypothetical protein
MCSSGIAPRKDNGKVVCTLSEGEIIKYIMLWIRSKIGKLASETRVSPKQKKGCDPWNLCEVWLIWCVTNGFGFALLCFSQSDLPA